MKNEDGTPMNATGDSLPEPVSDGLTKGTRNVLILATLLLIPTAVGCGMLLGMNSAVSAVIGGVIGLGNFWLLGRLVVIVTAGEELAAGLLLGRLLLKLLILGVILWVLIALVGIDGIGLLAGLSVVIVSTLLSQVFGLLW